MSQNIEILDKLPPSVEFRVVEDNVNYQGRKVQKIEYKEFISFPARFGKGIVAFLITLLTCGLGLAIPTVSLYWKESITGYKMKEGYLSIPKMEKPENVLKAPLTPSLPEIQKTKDPLPVETKQEEKIQALPPETIQKEDPASHKETNQSKDNESVPVDSDKTSHKFSEEIQQFENQLLNKLAGELKPDQKFSDLTEAEQTDLIEKIILAKDKIKRAWIRSKIPADERKEAIKTSCLISLFAKKWRLPQIKEMRLETITEDKKNYIEAIKTIQSGAFDMEIEKCVKACRYTHNRWGLILIAYTLFSKVKIEEENFVPYQSLKALLYDELSSLEDIEIVFHKCYQELKKMKLKNFIPQQFKFDSNGDITNFVGTKINSEREEGRYWSYKRKDSERAAPDDPITFSHGGGFFHLLDILRGISAGYPLEGDRGYGIQIHPRFPAHSISEMIQEREIHDYSSKATGHFDFPIRVLGESKAKFLEVAPNGYEAGIHAQDLRESISNLNIEFQKIANWDIKRPRFSSDDPLWAKVYHMTDEDLECSFPNNSEIRASIMRSLRRLRPKLA